MFVTMLDRSSPRAKVVPPPSAVTMSLRGWTGTEGSDKAIIAETAALVTY